MKTECVVLKGVLNIYPFFLARAATASVSSERRVIRPSAALCGKVSDAP